MEYIDIDALNTIIDSAMDEDVFKKIGRELFFRILEKAEIDLDKLASKRKKNDYMPFHKFNFIIKELHKTKKIDIADSCIFLQIEFLSTKEIINCLNDENKYSLRTSLAQRNNIQVNTSSLGGFMYNKNKKKKKKSKKH